MSSRPPGEKSGLAVSLFLFLSTAHLVCGAQIIDVGPATGESPAIGELPYAQVGVTYGSYSGQTFVAPDSRLVSGSFDVTTLSGDGDFERHLLVTEMANSNVFGNHPTNVLFESTTIAIPLDAGPTQLHFDFGGVLLTPGVMYAVVFDTVSVLDGVLDSAKFAVNSNNVYSAGFGFVSNYFVAGTDRALIFGSAGSFAGSPSTDVVMTLTFVPEPASAGMAVAGVALLVIFERSRRHFVRRSNRVRYVPPI